MNTRWGVLVVLATALPAVRPARADDREVARQHFVQGSKDFDLGLYDDAIKEYMAAYQAKDDPALLYNIAQAHRLAGHSAEALRFYRMYLVKVPDAPNADEVHAKIAELEKLIAQQKKTETMPPDQVKPLGSAQPPPAPAPPPASPAASPAPEAAPEPTPQANAIATPAPANDLHAGRSKEIAGLVVAGVGVAALASGIALAVEAKQASDDLSALDRAGGVWDPAKYSTGQTFNDAGIALLAVGAAAAVAGGVVAVLGLRESRRASRSQISFAPMVSPRLAGATAQVRF